MQLGDFVSEKKIFTDLEFFLWRIRYLPREEWREEILVMGSNKALETILQALISMRSDLQEYGKSTRKFLCNPPEDIDVIQYANEHNAEVEWLNWLIVKIAPGVKENTPFELRDKVVYLWLNEQTLEKYLEILQNQINSKSQYPHGQAAPGGLFFSPDWLGAE